VLYLIGQQSLVEALVELALYRGAAATFSVVFSLCLSVSLCVQLWTQARDEKVDARGKASDSVAGGLLSRADDILFSELLVRSNDPICLSFTSLAITANILYKALGIYQHNPRNTFMCHLPVGLITKRSTGKSWNPLKK